MEAEIAARGREDLEKRHRQGYARTPVQRDDGGTMLRNLEGLYESLLARLSRA